MIAPQSARHPNEPAEPLPPCNIEAEQALLGAILMNNEALYRVSDFLTADHFFEALHQAIYGILASLIGAGKPATVVTVKTFIPASVNVAGLDGTQYLARLAAHATSVINAADYGRTIHDLATRRALIDIAGDLHASALDAPVDTAPAQLIEDAERRLYEVAEVGRYAGGFHPFTEALTRSIDMAAKAYQRDGRLSGLATGLRDLDARMGGLQPSDVVVLAGRPGMGKTALATNIAYNIAKGWRGEVGADGRVRSVNGGIVGFFSLEMSSEQLATRIVAGQAEIPSYRIRRGEIAPEDFDRLAQVATEMQQLPLYIDESGGLSIAQLTARARRLKRQKGLDLLVVDYIQLASGSANKRNDNRVQEVTEITTRLKALAKELNVPVLALSQLSRKVEERDDKRPQLADLRESGSIEQDADVVLFVYREEYYLKNREPRPGTEEHFQWQQKMERCHGRAEIIVSKQRHGPTGTVDVSFQADVTRFADLAESDKLPERLG